MKNYKIVYCYIAIFLLTQSFFIIESRSKKHKNSDQKIASRNDDHLKTITIDYNNTELSTIINQLAALKQVNILLPITGIKEKVTFSLDKKVTIDEAWTLLQTLLDVAEYTMTPKNNVYSITKNIKDIGREPLTIYFNSPYHNLPDSDETIRYIHYLTNIKVTDDTSNEINTLLKELLPPNSSSFITDPVSNSFLIAAHARDIKSVMAIISRLDQPGFEEKMEIIPLQFSRSNIIAELFNENILKTTQSFQPYNIKAPQKSDTSYFEKDTRIMSDDRTNSLIVVGRAQAVDRVKEFIHTHLDVPLDSGKSILHVYELQYLNAEKFESVLKNIVASASDGGTGQSRSTDAGGGIERYFDGVKIKADSFINTDKTSGGSNAIIGSNKLIIAARNDDWKRIKELIQKLDVPQRQVFIEILVADLTIDDQRNLGSILRNPAKIPLPGQMDFQSAQLNPGVIPNTFGDPTAAQTVGYIDNNGNPVASDLMRNAIDENGQKTDAGEFALTSQLQGGTTALSFSDSNGKTWSLLQILKLFGHSKILTHPHVLAMHNQEAMVKVGNTRFLQDAVSGNINPQVTNKSIEASLTVNITPRISTSEMVNMQIEIDINEFLPSAGNARTTRKVTTNANIANGGVLAIGGLVQKNEQISANETPVLARIPLIGWFFKNKNQGIVETNLTVFICPTIIEPSVRNGIAQYTKDYIQLSKEYSNDSGLFSDLRDPITHWFFTSKREDSANGNEQKVIDEFFAKNNSYDTENELQDDSYCASKEKIDAIEKPSEKFFDTEPKKIETTYNKQANVETLKAILKDEENPFIINEKPVHITT